MFCLLMNESQFLLLAAYLKLENVNDIILVHSSPINRDSSMFQLVRRHLDWAKVGMLHTFSGPVQETIFRGSMVATQIDTKISPSVGSSPSVGNSTAAIVSPPGVLTVHPYIDYTL